MQRAHWGKALVAVMVALLVAVAVYPSAAETAGQQSTRNIILAATAVTLGIVLYNNYEHKTVSSATIVGRTGDGGVVYGDGRMVYPGGVVVYASNDGIHLCAYYGVGARCGPRAYGYAWRYEGEKEWHGEGLHKGWNKGKGNPHHDQGDDDNHR